MTAWDHPATLAGAAVDWGQQERLLVVRPDNLGDVVLCGPALRALRRAAPRARLDLLAAPAGAAAAPLLPEVDAVLLASVSWQQIDPAAIPADDDLALVRRIADGRYDAAIILTSASQSPWPAGYLCRLAGVPVRVGTSAEFGGAGLTHWVPAPPDGLHQADRALHVLRRVGVPPMETSLRLRIPPAARQVARRMLAAAGVAVGEPYVLLLPGASCPSRRYPADRFRTVVALLAQEGARVVVAGPAREAPLLDEVAAGSPDAVAAAGFDVPALAAAVADADVVVCNNSGGTHLADALGRPVVVLFGGTERVPEYAPRFFRSAVLRIPTVCSPCRQLSCPYELECLDLPPEEVARHALRLRTATTGAGRRAGPP